MIHVSPPLNVAELARAIEIERPKIAILSATESQIASVPSSLEAAEIADACRIKDKTADYEGRSLLIWRSRHKLLPKKA